MNLDALIRDQNPQWFDPNYHPSEKDWYERDLYQKIKNHLSDDLIISLTGLRRVGKSTLMKQALNHLLITNFPKNIFYFSFDESVIKKDTEILRQILENYAISILGRPLNKTDQKIFIFLDEIQIIPYWQDIIKTYYDLNPNLKFIVSGSSALFISRKSTESLAGRIGEIVVPPLSFKEYLDLNGIIKKEIHNGLEEYARLFPEYLSSFFENYLQIGQFPQPLKNNYSKDDTEKYLQTIEDKIIEIDLPKTFYVKRLDILKIIFSYFKQSSGNLLSYENLTNDLGVDIRTTVKYIDWLKKAFLINICLNQTKKIVKSGRTSKKIYLTSTNFAQNLPLGNKVETYIFNFLKNLNPHVEFFRFQTQEIDFIITTKTGQKIPLEVKYQENIKESDEKNLRMFIKRYQPRDAFLITKNLVKQPKKIDNTLLYYFPAAQIELNQEALKKKLER